MSKVDTSMEYQEIIDRLDCLREHNLTETELSVLQEAMDIISDYEKVVSELNRLLQHYETEAKSINRNGAYCCPECGRRVQFNHSHCHYCGKRIGWK